MQVVNDFSKDNLISFKLNNIDYTFYSYIIEKIGLFNLLIDCDCTSGIHLYWDVSPETANSVFRWINDNSYSKFNCKSADAKYCVEIISFMKYLHMDHNIIRKIIKKLLKDVYIVQYIIDLLDLPLSDLILDTITDSRYWSNNCFCVDSVNIDIYEEILKVLDKFKPSSIFFDDRLNIIKNSISFLSKNSISQCNGIGELGIINAIYQSYNFEGLTCSIKHCPFIKIYYQDKCIYDNITDKCMKLIDVVIDNIAKLLLDNM